MDIQNSNKKEISAWTLYDWANSVYSLTIATTIFPIYYNIVTTSPSGSNEINFLGITFINTALYSYAISVAFLVIAFVNPVLSGVADYSGRKKNFMQLFCYLGSFSCFGLFWFTENTLELGILFSILACIGYAGSIVFYNAYLPEICPPERQDAVSAKGYSMGYIGSIVLLIVNLIFIRFPEFFGFSENSTLPTRISFLTVGVWWVGFAQITFRNLPKPKSKQKLTKEIVLRGYKELHHIWRELKQQRKLKTFLFAFFFYNMAVQTVLYLATLFGAKEIAMQPSQLIITILLIQIVAIGGAYSFAWISGRYGNIKALMASILIWIVVCVCAYFVRMPHQFMALAAAVGLVMGGTQALSRSTYSKLLPKTTFTASYFSFYDVVEKIAIVIGTFSYGYIEFATGSMRNAILFLTMIFIISIFFLWKLRKTAFGNDVFNEEG